jgi:hypothetical protein
MGAAVQIPPWDLEPHQQPFTAQPEGRSLEAPCAFKPKASFGLLQVSLSHLRGGLRRLHEFVMPCPACNYVRKIVLQFYVSFYVFIPHVVSYFFPVLSLVQVVQSCHRQVCLRYL